MVGAIEKNTYIAMLRTAGFQDVEVLKEIPFSIDCMLNDPTANHPWGYPHADGVIRKDRGIHYQCLSLRN